MARKLDPGMLSVLTAGAIGTGLAIVSGTALWLVASGFGISYAIEEAGPVSLRDVIASLVVVGLAATALALTVRNRRRGPALFAGLCLISLGLSILTPLTLAQEPSTAWTLAAHHVIGGLLIAAPLMQSFPNTGRVRSDRAG